MQTAEGSNEILAAPSMITRKPPHPLKMPNRATPDKTTSICRYHNYRSCLKGEVCDNNHTLCHICYDEEHRAVDCPTYLDEEAFKAWREETKWRPSPDADHRVKIHTTLNDEIIFNWAMCERQGARRDDHQVRVHTIFSITP